MYSPTVTVICTCYNHEKYVYKSLQSVVNQTYKNIQLIVVDNASTDNSVKEIHSFLTKHPDTRFIHNNENLGLNKSFNAAVKHAKGKYLIDLAADDELYPDRVSLQVSKFEELEPKFGLIYSNVEEIDSDDKHIRYSLNKEKVYPSGKVFIELLKNHFIPSPSTIFRKEIFDNIGGYNEALAFEDFDFWVKCANKYDFYYLSIVSTKKRILKDSQSSFFFSPTKSAKMLESTLATYTWAKRHIIGKDDFQSYDNGILYYYKQCVLLGHFDLAKKFKCLMFKQNRTRSLIAIGFLLAFQIDVSSLYSSVKRIITL